MYLLFCFFCICGKWTKQKQKASTRLLLQGIFQSRLQSQTRNKCALKGLHVYWRSQKERFCGKLHVGWVVEVISSFCGLCGREGIKLMSVPLHLVGSFVLTESRHPSTVGPAKTFYWFILQVISCWKVVYANTVHGSEQLVFHVRKRVASPWFDFFALLPNSAWNLCIWHMPALYLLFMLLF